MTTALATATAYSVELINDVGRDHYVTKHEERLYREAKHRGLTPNGHPTHQWTPVIIQEEGSRVLQRTAHPTETPTHHYLQSWLNTNPDPNTKG